MLSLEKSIPQSILSDFPEDIGTVIRTNRESIVSNIEIHPTRDYLLELNLITLEEHRDILQLRTRQQQRTCLLTILLAKDDRRWLKGFLYILKETNQTHIIDCDNLEAQTEEGSVIFHNPNSFIEFVKLKVFFFKNLRNSNVLSIIFL